jgi:ATP adenylyltransferase
VTRRPLWAPWRIDYIQGPKSQECIFCDSAGTDRDRLILHRGGRVSVMLNRFPYCLGHVMVAPNAHVARIHDLEAAAREELFARVADSSRILDELFACDGQNIGINQGAAAGAGFGDHIHVHLVPRWKGDTNFMTAVAELRVIPDHLDRTWEQLAPRFAELP